MPFATQMVLAISKCSNGTNNQTQDASQNPPTVET
jgi:hypothetical protein